MFLWAKKAPDGLPPTQDALLHHIQRVHYQVTVWTQVLIPKQTVPDPTDLGGWRKDESQKCLVPVLISKEPVPVMCLDMVVCGCKTKCSTGKCTCYTKELVFTGACGCAAEDCKNPIIYTED
jgi:hypothetical protein